MLTLEKLNIYNYFGGDIDGWARTSKKNNSSGMTDEDWTLIDKLIQGLFLVSTGAASAEYATSIEHLLLSATEDEKTRQELRKMAK